MKHDDPRYLAKVGRAGTVKGIPGRATSGVARSSPIRIRSTRGGPNDPGSLHWEYEQRKATWAGAHKDHTHEEYQKACLRFARELGL